MRNQSELSYRRRINGVVAHVNAHLDGDLEGTHVIRYDEIILIRATHDKHRRDDCRRANDHSDQRQ